MILKILVFLFFLYNSSINAQTVTAIDSLRGIINQGKGDTNEVNALLQLAAPEVLPGIEKPFDSTLKYAGQALSLAKKLHYRKGEADSYWLLSSTANRQGNYPQAIKYALTAQDIYHREKENARSASVELALQGAYREAGDYEKSLDHAFKGYREIIETNNDARATGIFTGHRLVPLFLAEIAQTFLLNNQLDSALAYTQKAISENELFNGAIWNFPLYLLATIQTIQGNYQPALENYRSAIPLAIQNGFFRDTLQIFSGMSTLFKKTGQLDSAVHYAQTVVQAANPELEIKNLLEAVINLEEVYKLKGNKDSTFKYIELGHNIRDSIFSREKDRELQNISFNQQLKQQELLSAQESYKNRIRFIALAAGLFVLFLVATILWRNNLQKQKAKIKIEQAYNELKHTQAQLIQSAKMASLGELTAGIAHEIQNPLNFVNNFSEINKELLGEMSDALQKGNSSEVQAIANDIVENEEKISYHGKRADAIVKGMLQHSRAATGHKELTDINALADDYLRLSYHGMRAKDKTFNATLQTNFDESIGRINIIPQEIGSVLLNLYNNAFYAVSEKKKLLNGTFEPTIEVTTRPSADKIEIRVKDNGTGIPEKAVDKIFQPFFTTKPTGQGTGLGLSLSYDIVKAHGGEIKVESKDGEGSEFLIELPFKP